MSQTARQSSGYPGANLGMPRTGRGSVASWLTRITALVLDWAAAMILAFVIFGTAGLNGGGWRSFIVLAIFFVESSALSFLAGGSFGQLITRISVTRLDGKHLGFVRAIARALLVCLVIPALVIDENRRGLHDLVCGTAVLRLR